MRKNFWYFFFFIISMRRLNFSSRSFYILILYASDRYNNGSDLIVQRNCPLLTVLSNLCENLWNCVEIFLLNLLARLILKYSSRTVHDMKNEIFSFHILIATRICYTMIRILFEYFRYIILPRCESTSVLNEFILLIK